jgi:periplasmic protein TonB
MKTNKKIPSPALRADLDEIVFRSRNRAYGAYPIRKRQVRTLLRAFFFSVLFFFAAFTAPLIARYFRPLPTNAIPIPVPPGDVMVEMTLKAIPEEVIPEVKPASPPPAVKTKRYTDIVVVEHHAATTPTITRMDSLADALPGKVDSPGKPGGETAQPGVSGGNGNAPAIAPPATDPEPFEFIPDLDKEPNALNFDALRKSISYPPQAKEICMSGKVVLRILVGVDGRYLKHFVVKSPHPLLTKAVVEKIEMLHFSPGMQAGRPIKVWVTLPFDFRLL